MSMDNKGGLEGFSESIESLREAASQIFKTRHLIAAGVLGSLAAGTEPLWSPHFHKTMNIVLTTSLLLGACAPGVVPRPTAEGGSTPDSVATEEGMGMGEAFTKDEALKAMEAWKTFTNGLQNGQMTGTPECVPTAPGSENLLTFNPQKPTGEIDRTISYGFCTAPVTITGGETDPVSQGSAFFLKHDSVANTTEAYILIKATETDYQVGGLRDGKTYRESFDLRYSPGPNGEDQFKIVNLNSAGEEVLDAEGLPSAAGETYDVVFKTNGSGFIDLTPTPEAPQPGEVGYKEAVENYHGKGSATIEVIKASSDYTQHYIDHPEEIVHLAEAKLDHLTSTPYGSYQDGMLYNMVISKMSLSSVDVGNDGTVDGKQMDVDFVYKLEDGTTKTMHAVILGYLNNANNRLVSVDDAYSNSGLSVGNVVVVGTESVSSGSNYDGLDLMKQIKATGRYQELWGDMEFGLANWGHNKVSQADIRAAFKSGTLNIDGDGISCSQISTLPH